MTGSNPSVAVGGERKLAVSDLTGGWSVVQEKFERLHVAIPTSAGIPPTTRMKLPPRQSGHRISNRNLRNQKHNE